MTVKGPGAIDWGIGRYETTAAELEPVAAHVVELAQVHRGQRVLDLATGTGNAALACARQGAVATGIDAASRLIDVARDRAAAEGLNANFKVGDLHELPFGQDAFELALSVFGIIFAADPQRAIDEVMRVLAPGGRALFSTWIPAGPIDAMVGVFMRAVAGVTGPPPARFQWHDPAEVERLLGPHGARVSWQDGMLLIEAVSPEEYFESQQGTHPMSVALRPLVERAGDYAAVREEALTALRNGNESADAFRVSSPYRVFEIEKVS